MAKKQAEEEEKSDGLMDRIRGYAMSHGGIGAADDREADIAMNVDTSSGTTKGYADGGVLGDDFDVDGGDSQTVKGLPLNPASLPQPEAPIAQEPTAALPQKAPMMPAAAPAPIARPLPGMPPVVTPDVLQQYLQGQRAQINKYSPDRQFDQEQAMLKARTGLGMGLANAGATFADALMQGVARAGNPGFAKAQMDQANQIAGETTGAEERARKGTMEQVEANQKIDTQDPNSMLSKASQQAYAPIFQKMGYSPEAVMKMPASQLNTIADLGVRYADAQTQLELKKAMLQVQTMSAQATMQNQRAERSESETKLRAEHPILSALGKLGPTASVGATSGPLGATTIKNGVTYEWSPISHKYHPKGT